MISLALVALIVVVTAGVALLAQYRVGVVDLRAGRLRTVEAGTRRWRALGVIAGLAGGGVAMSEGALGRGILLAAPIFGLCVLTGVVVGELRVAPPGGPARRAALEVRRVGAYLPRRLGGAVAATTALLAAVMILTTLTGSPDDLGRAGRALVRHCSATQTQGAGPWPGSYYTGPLTLVVVVGLACAALAARRIVLRPRLGEGPGADDFLRRQAVSAVVAATGILVAVPLAGISFVAASAMLDISCRPQWWSVIAWALLALCPALVALVGWCAAALTPRRASIARDRSASATVR